MQPILALITPNVAPKHHRIVEAKRTAATAWTIEEAGTIGRERRGRESIVSIEVARIGIES